MYKSVWQEQFSPCQYGENPLKLAREYRDRIWWEGVKGVAHKKRRLDHLAHSRGGMQRTPWEQPFLNALGIDWRHQRDRCDNLATWMHGCDSFVHSVCQQWNLPGLVLDKPESERPRPKHVRLPSQIDQMPPRPAHHLDQSWQSSSGQVWIQVDCKALAELLSGRAVLTADDMRPLCTRVARALLHLSSLGWKPQNGASDMIVWSPRSFNAAADHAVNATLDEQQDWWRVDQGSSSATAIGNSQ